VGEPAASESAPPRDRRRRRRRLFALGALLTGALAALAIGEVAVRVAGSFNEPRRHFKPGIFAPDEELGWVLQPDYEGVRAEYAYGAVTTTDGRGYRGPAWDDARAGAECRVLCLGDSVTFGLGVEDDETFPARLEALLREGGREAAVYNAGVPGYDTVQEGAVLERLRDVVRPDVVVVGWLPNDVTEPSVLARDQVQVLEGYLVDDVEEFREWRGRIDHRGLYASALYRFMRVRTKLLQEALGADDGDWPGLDGDLSYSTDPLRAIAARARELGAAPVLVLFPREEEVRGDTDVDHHAAVADLGREAGYAVVDLAAAWVAAGPRDDRYLPRDGVHLTASGYAEAAGRVAPVVADACAEAGE